MKIIKLLFCLVALIISPYFTYSQEAACNVDHGNQIQADVIEANNSSIQYHEGKVMFFADPSNIGIAALGTLSLALLGASVGCGINRNKESALVFAFAGIVSGTITIRSLLKKLSNIPYLILDREGLICTNERKLLWRDVKSIRVGNLILFGKVAGIVAVQFIDNSDKILFDISGDFKALSSQSLGVFVTLASLYRNQALCLPSNTSCIIE